jgi:hypothetical protein
VLELHRQRYKASFFSAKGSIEWQIAAEHKEIDHVVYQLCGLREVEIRIVEGN